VVQKWETPSSRILYRRFLPGESLNKALEALAVSEGIREATIESCIGSLSQLKLRNLCQYVEGSPEFELQTIEGNLELVSAEGYIQPLPEGGLRVHIHVAAARPTGEMVGGHCEDATILTGAFMYVHVIEDEPNS
jgi:predicted DNA-binding protein with PD1-like motif